jgi:glyoxylase-like metal-dependent hydrolase (beta-lactamase superfamily II)
MAASYERVGEGIFAVDTEYLRRRLDASHLIIDDGRAAFVDAGTELSVPKLLDALAAEGIDAADVDYIFLTHVHLDHAAGAGRLAAALPRAQVLVHPRGAAHMIDPTKLVAAATAVYGERMLREHYGEILPIPAARVVAVEDGHRVRLGRRSFEFLHTPGHALHHVCIVDRDAGDLFAGDTFGISYREFDVAGRAFIFPTSSPSQFDPAQLHASVTRIMKCKPRAVYLTHYSRVSQAEELGADLHADIDTYVRIAHDAASLPDRALQMASRMFDHLSRRLDEHGYSRDAAQRHALLDLDVRLNADGLDIWLARTAA